MPLASTDPEIDAGASLPSRILKFYPCLAIALLVAAGAILRFRALGQKSVWIDEAVSIEMARLDWYNFVRILWRHEANMALYTLLLRFWLPFGDSEAWIRALSVVSGLATIVAVYLLGRRLFNPQTGLIASFLVTINAFHVRYSQEARSYSLFALLCVLSCIYFVKFVQEPSRENRMGHVVTSVLAVYAHFFAGLLIVGQWLSLRILEPREVAPRFKKNWRQFALAISPLIIFVATTGLGILRWIPRPGFAFVQVTFVLLTGNGGERLLWLYAAAGAPPVMLGLPALLRKRRLAWEEWRYWFLAIWVVFPVAAVFVISQWKPCLLPRYFVSTVPALALLAAAGLARLLPRWAAGVVMVVFAMWSLPAVYSYYTKDFDIGREDFRAATQFILSQALPGDAVLFHQPIGRMPYEYYRRLIPAPAFPTVAYPAYGRELTFRDFYARHAGDDFIKALPQQYRRVWIVFTYNELPSGPDATTRLIEAAFSQQKLVESRKFPGVEIRMYSKSGD